MQGIQFQENYIQRLPAGLSVEQIIRQLAQPLVAAELVVQAQCNCRRHPAGTGRVCRYGRRS